MTNTNANNDRHGVRRLAWSCVLAAGLLAGTASTAYAHPGRHEPVPVYDYHFAADYRPAYPHWLRKHRAFKRWYVRSPYYRQARRHHRHAHWGRLYQLYLIERLEAARHGKHRRDRYHDHYAGREYQARNRRDDRHRRRHGSD